MQMAAAGSRASRDLMPWYPSYSVLAPDTAEATTGTPDVVTSTGVLLVANSTSTPCGAGSGITALAHLPG